MKLKDSFGKKYVWILLLILVAIVFMFRFKYMLAGDRLVRISRITGEAKLYEYDRDSGKFVHSKTKKLQLPTLEEELDKFMRKE